MTSTDRFLVLGLARPRTPWLAEIGRWSASSTIPIEFIRCLSADEVRSRLETDRRHSAVLVDERTLGVDRELFDCAHAARCAVIVLVGARPRHDWVSMGATVTVAEPLDPDTLTSTLREHAMPSQRRPSPLAAERSPDHMLGPLISVTGTGGSGTSLCAIAVAMHLARSTPSPVALVDACRNADQALLHDLGDVLPGLPELVERHRIELPDPGVVRSHLWACPRHGYDLLPGLRRHREWSSLRRRSTTAALHSLRSAYGLVVADVDPDVEGERETGSIDIEERNHLSRELLASSDVVVVTSRTGLTGTSRLIGTITELENFGVDPSRIVPVVIGAPRGRRERSALVVTIRDLLQEVRPVADRRTPVMVPIRRDVDAVVLDALEPASLVSGAIGHAVDEVLRSEPLRRPAVDEPIAIVPGHLGLTA